MMKLITKKSKFIFLVIILVGAVMLAYNSLNHNLEYLNLNEKNNLGSSPVVEGFDDYNNTSNNNNNSNSNNDGYEYETRDAPLSSLKQDLDNLWYGKDDNNDNASSSSRNDYHRYDHHQNDHKKKCKNKNRRPHHNSNHRHHRDDEDNNNSSYQSSDSYDKFNNNSSLYATSNSDDNNIMNDYDANSLYKNNTNKMSGDKKKYVKKHQIPKGDEDLYILKSEIVPPVCPMCPSSVNCSNSKPPPPCPACARCPESPFECKKVPNYTGSDFLPMPVLNDFSTFGM